MSSGLAVAAEMPWITVPDTRKALAVIAANYFGRPAEVLKLVGVTGTNGKTTVASLKKWNSLRGNTIRAGERLTIFTTARTTSATH